MHKKRIHNRDYYYASYRGEDGKVCSKYLGSDEKLALKKEKDMDGGKADLYVYSLIFLLLGLCFFGGMFSYTGFVTYNGGVDLSWNESWDVDSSFVRVSLGSDVYDIPVSVVDGSVVVDLSVFDFNSTGVGYVDLIVNESVVDSASFEIAEESYFNESLSAQNLTLNDTELNNSVDGFNSSLDLNESVSLNESLDLNESVEESLNVSVDVPVVNETVEDVDESVELVNESVEDVDETVEEVLNESLNVSVEVPIVNLTANETVIIPVNITNQTVNYTIAGVNVSEEVVQYGAVIGEPVKWKKKIVLSESTANLSVDIPETAENVTVVEIVDDVETVLDNVKVNNSGVISDLDGSDLDSPTGFFNLISGMFSASITGFFVAGEPVENITLIIEEEVEEVEVEYYTEAPEASEENTSYGKKVVVSSETHYENILTYTTIPEIALDAVNLYWIVNGSRVVHSFDGYDTNADGLVDYLEWVTPHTSEQEFQIELTILNVQSYPFVGGSWTVMFNTSGTADLSVNAINTTSFGVDLQFIEIRCGEDVVNSSYNGSIFVADYSCNQTGFEESRVLTAGVHDLEFRFGDLVAYAHNDASYPNCTGATSNGIWVINDSQTVNDTVTCNTITIQDGGTLVVDTTVNNVSITINATNITVDVGGSINANEKGWMLSEGPGQGSTGTYDQGGGGGGYGGKGGNGESGVAGGSHFGDSLVPTRLGSGGGYCSQASCNSGGSGGGAIKLDVIDTFTLNGSVSADGESGTTYQTFYAGGGGSAGSIFVNTSVLRGIGNFSAVGGDGADNSGGDGGGGSGGRVAVYYDSVEDVDITTSTVAGGTGPGSAQDGDPGTLGFIDRDDRHLTIYSGWEFSSNMNYTNVSVYSSLTRMNKSINMNASNWNAFGDFNMTCYGNTYDFTLDVVNDVNFSRSTIKNLGRANLDCDNVDVNATESSVVFMEDITIEVGGNISLDLGNDLVLNDSSLSSNRELQWMFFRNISNLSLQNVNIKSNLNWSLINLSVDSLSKLNATTKGYNITTGPGEGTTGTYNEGAGGGGYGGKAGNGETGKSGGSHFGDALVPVRFGSGGGYCSQPSCSTGSSAGGAIILRITDTFTLNGSVSADGEAGTTFQTFYAGGGGSAGSIFVNTSIFRGTGSFSAVGGTGGDNSGGDGGGGSGGRVAVYYDSVEDVDITTSTVAGGTGPGSAQEGDPGTLGFIDRDDRHLTIYSGWEFASNMNYTNVSVYSSLTRMNKSINMNASNWNSLGDFNMTCYANTYDFTLDVVNDANFSRSAIKNLGNANLDCDNVYVNATESGVVFMEDITIEAGGNVSLDLGNNLVLNDSSLFSNRELQWVFFRNISNLSLQNVHIKSNINLSLVNFSVDILSKLNSTGKGYNMTLGSGQGGDGGYRDGGGGAGYGGIGGTSWGGSGNSPGGSHFGDALVPVRFGSGGGYCSQGACNKGSAGGGSIILRVSDTFTLNGTVDSNGEKGHFTGSDYTGGGGSGGSIFVNASVFRGIGNFSAVGGSGADNSNSDGGGGSGGRVAVYYDSVEDVDITDSVVTGGTGPGSAQDGDPGTLGFIDRDDRHLTIYDGWEFSSNMNYTNVSVYSSLTRMNASINMNASNWNSLGDFNMTCYANTYDFTLDVVNDANFSRSAIKNFGLANLDCDNVYVNATESGVVFMEDITIEAGGNVSLDLGNVLTLNNSDLSHNRELQWVSFHNVSNLVFQDVDILGNINWSLVNFSVDSLSSLNATGKGYNMTTGLGQGGDGGYRSGGGAGGYGAKGGNGEAGVAGGVSYGSFLMPSDFGSGGGYCSQGACNRGSAGGGIIIFNVKDTFVLNTTVSVDGEKGHSTGSDYAGGGGSGGSIYVNTSTLSGVGDFTALGASGGDTTYADGGGGSGGRIAVYYETLEYMNITGIGLASGSGPGDAQDGGDGSLFKCDTVPGVGCNPLSSSVLWISSVNADQRVEYTVNQSIEINKTITTWNATVLLWNDSASNVTTLAIYNTSGLTSSINYTVANNSIEFSESPMLTSAAGNMDLFNLSLAADQQVQVQELVRPVVNSVNTFNSSGVMVNDGVSLNFNTNVTYNLSVTSGSNSISAAWVVIWSTVVDGAEYANELMTFDGTNYSVDIYINNSLYSLVNYTVYSNDTLNYISSQNGNFSLSLPPRYDGSTLYGASFMENVTINSNVTGVGLVGVNFTITRYTDNVNILDNVAAVVNSSMLWNSSSTNLSQCTEYNYSVLAWNSGGLTSTSYGNITLVCVDVNLNSSSVNVNSSVEVTGSFNLTNGSAVSANGVEIYYNDDLKSNAANWWNTSWKYRTNVTVNTGYMPRGNNTYVKRIINFSSLMSDAGISGTLDNKSIRVADMNGREMDSNILKWIVVNDTGMLRWKLTTNGTINKGVNYSYYIYFDTVQNGLKESPTYSLSKEFWLCSGADSGNDLYYAYSTYNRTLPSSWTIWDPQSSSEKDESTIADFDNDGDYDVIFTSDGANSAYVYSNDGDASWSFTLTQTITSIDYNWNGICEGDFNEDGWLDIVINDDNCVINYYQNDGDGTFTYNSTAGDCGGEPRKIACGDLNGDDNIDILAGAYSNGGLYWIQGDGDGTFTSIGNIADSTAQGDDWHGVWLVDSDNDGDLDAYGQSNNAYADYFANNGTGGYANGVELTDGGLFDSSPSQNEWGSGTVGDYDNDGAMDVTEGSWTSGTSDMIVYWGNNSKSDIFNSGNPSEKSSSSGMADWEMWCGGKDAIQGINISVAAAVVDSSYKTNSSAGFSYNITVDTAGVLPVKVNTTFAGIYGWSFANIDVYQQPAVNTVTFLGSNNYANNITLQANISDDNLVGVNFTITRNDGTVVLNNQLGTNGTATSWNSTSVNLTQCAEHNYTIYALDAQGYNVTSYGNITLLCVELNLNATSVALNGSVLVSGIINLTNGTAVANTIINLYLNESLPTTTVATHSGGTITSYLDENNTNYSVHTFTSSGSFNISANVTVEVLVVAAGGGGGGTIGGGGGAGGLIYNSSYPVTAETNYAVTIGSGGNGGVGWNYQPSAGTNGGNSVFSTLTAVGGGGGAGHTTAPVIGGSGGGGANSYGTGAAGTAGQGNSGGLGTTNDGGGGGGAGASGTNYGAGGAGLNYSINGSNVYYAGGGGGGGRAGPGSADAGGIGGGGAGSLNSVLATAGTPNTGGGGGGSGYNGASSSVLGGGGGSGIVIIKYLTSDLSTAITTNASGWYTYNLTLNTTGLQTIKVNTTFTSLYGESFASLDVVQAPTVTLGSPANNNFSVALESVYFNCSVIDADGDLANVTLYHNLGGTWGSNGTRTVSGSANESIFVENIKSFTSSSLRDSNFIWNCYARDGTNLVARASNATFGSWDLGNYTDDTLLNSSSLFLGLDDNDTKQEISSDWVNTTDLVLLYHFNNDSGYSENDQKNVSNSVYDFSGLGNNGSLGNVTSSTNPVWNITGKLGGGYSFDGKDDYIDLGLDNSLKVSYGYSISAWINAPAIPNDALWAIVSSQKDSTTNGVSIILDGRSNPDSQTAPRRHIHFQTGDGTWYTTNVNAVVPTNEWVHIVATRDAGEDGKVYYNGILKPSTSANSYSGAITFTNNWQIGRQADKARHFNGSIDEVGIWNRTLSAAEILEIYDKQKGIYLIDGNYTSRVLDAGRNSTWLNVTWDENLPYGEELPSNQGVETSLGGVNMTGNVLLYHFNNDSSFSENDQRNVSNSVYDFSGLGNNGSLGNASASSNPVWNISGKLGGAYSFNRHFIYANTVSPYLSGDFTLSTWVQSESNTDGQFFASFNTQAGGNTLLFGSLGGKSNLSLYDTDGWEHTNKSFIDGNWHHVMFILDAGNSGTFYLDGVNVFDYSTSTTIGSTDSFSIGMEYDSANPSNFWNGSIDEFAIWNRSLSNAEILNVYKRGALRLNLSARSCDDSSCVGESWTGVGGNASFESISLVTNRYFQYMMSYESDDTLYTPELNLSSVVVGYTVLNTAPQVTNVTMNSTSGFNYSNSSLQTYWKIWDADGDSESASWTWWWKDGVKQSALENESSITANNLSKNEKWNMSVRLYDSLDWSNWSGNVSVTVANTPPNYTLLTPTDAQLLLRSVSPLLNVSFTDPDSDPINVSFINDSDDVILCQVNNSNKTSACVWSDLNPNMVYSWYVNISDGDEVVQTDTFNFTPNNEPGVKNMRLEMVNASAIRFAWENEPDMSWVSLRIGSDILELRSITSSNDNWTVYTIYPDQEYVFEWQTGDDLLAQSDYHNFTFKTFGWHTNLTNFTYRRVMTVNQSNITTDVENYGVNITLTEENFEYSASGVWYPSFKRMNWSNNRDFRFVDYKDKNLLAYNVTYWNVPGRGGVSVQTSPNATAQAGGWVDFSQGSDEDWDTQMTPSPYGEYYYNYTIPVGAKNGSKYRIYDGGWGWDLTLPVGCYGGTDLQFKTASNYSNTGVNTYCWNNTGSEWAFVRNNGNVSAYVYEVMMTWLFDCEVHITVMPQHYNDTNQTYNSGLDTDYDVKFWMYYGSLNATDNTTVLSPTGIWGNATHIAAETARVLGTPAISNINDTVGRTSTGTNISWDTDQSSDHRVRYSDNKWFLNSTWHSRKVNNSETCEHLYGNDEQTVLISAYGDDYIQTLNVSCENANYNSNYTINESANPVSIVFADLDNSTFFNWTVNYTWNRTQLRDKFSAEYQLESLPGNATYYYEINVYGQTANNTDNSTFTLGTAPSTPALTILNYSENRSGKQATICANLTNLNSESEVNCSIQYWNQSSVDFMTSNITNLSAIGTYCFTVDVEYGQNYTYRAKGQASTTGYSLEYLNDFMLIQEFFAGSYVEDDNDDRNRQFCPDGPAIEPCYEQTGYLEGSLQEEDWIWIETNQSNRGNLTVNWWNGSVWTPYNMTNDGDSDMQYLKLEDLGPKFQTFYITNDSDDLVFNWTKPSPIHSPKLNRTDESKYVSFNGTPAPVNYTLLYFDAKYYNSSAYQWCMAAPGGNLYDCMSIQYFGGGLEGGWGPEYSGTAYDRGRMFRGGIANGELNDTGVLNLERRTNFTDAYDYRYCFAFTVFWWNESVVPNNNVTNYYYHYWTQNDWWSDYFGATQSRRFDFVSLFTWEYDLLSQTRDWNSIDNTTMLTERMVLNTSNSTFNTPYNQSLVIGHQTGFAYDVRDDQIYDFGFYTDGRWTNQQFGQYQQGFVVFNLPPNATLQAMDTDNDSISDFDELFVYYTNPKHNDTDEDGRIDSDELNLSYDPNLFTQYGTAPTVEVPVLDRDSHVANTSYVANATYSDFDSDNATVYIVWYKNGVAIYNETQTSVINGTVINSTLDSNNFSKSDVINVSIYAVDTFTQTSTLVNTTTTVQNLAPLFNVSLGAKAVNSTDDFTYHFNCSDIDGDSISYYDNSSLFEVNITTGYINVSASQADFGTHRVNVTCGDGTNNRSQIMTYTINDTEIPIVTKVGPEFVVKNRNPVLRVTSNENSNCQFRRLNTSFIDFGITGTTNHNHTLNLGYGMHTYRVRCNDSTGNINISDVHFYVTGVDSRRSNFNFSNFNTSGTTVFKLMNTFNASVDVTENSSSYLLGAEYTSNPSGDNLSVDGFNVDSLAYFSVSTADEVRGNLTSVSLQFGYSESDLTDLGITESDLTVYYYNDSADSWTEQTVVANTALNYLEVNLTHMSVFFMGGVAAIPAAAEEEEAAAGGGGGGGASRDDDVMRAAEFYIAENFTLSESSFSFDLAFEESDEQVLTITNNLGSDQKFVLSTEYIGSVLTLSSHEFTLASFESIDITLHAVSDREPGVHVGNLIVESDYETEILPLVVEISSQVVLFDGTVYIPTEYKEIGPGTSLPVDIILFNVGSPRKVDVLLNYIITDIEGNTVVEESETIAVEGQHSFTREFYVPSNVDYGTYVLALEVIYVNSVATSTTMFDVVSGVDVVSAVQNNTILYLLLGVVVMVGLIGFVVLFRRRKSA